jgi:WXG100 family type VII secretion target
MAGGFTGTPEQFTDAEKNVTNVKSSMDQQLSQLRDRIEATRAGWSGEAAKAFDAVMLRFDEDGRGLNTALQNIGDLLQQAGSKYSAAEQQQQDSVSSLNKGFGVLG